jgi:glycolate oxidase FAD binding subunit
MDLTTQQMADQVRESLDGNIWLEGLGTRIPCPVPMERIRAPRGILSFIPEEMTVTCGAGTPVDELMATLGERGQYVNLPVGSSGSGTVGGALAVGEGDIYRLGRGSVRDVLLQANFVDSSGTLIKAGGPTVKNVSGFDLCRLLVGSCGRLGFMAEVILRTRPRALATRWFETDDADADAVSILMERVNRPTSVLWNGSRILLCLEGHPEDIDETVHNLQQVLGRPVVEGGSPNLDGFPHRWICAPRDIEQIVSSHVERCIAEIATGVVHHVDPQPTVDPDPEIMRIEQGLLESFDPHDRLNGGTQIWGRTHTRRIQTVS